MIGTSGVSFVGEGSYWVTIGDGFFGGETPSCGGGVFCVRFLISIHGGCPLGIISFFLGCWGSVGGCCCSGSGGSGGGTLSNALGICTSVPASNELRLLSGTLTPKPPARCSCPFSPSVSREALTTSGGTLGSVWYQFWVWDSMFADCSLASNQGRALSSTG